MSEWLEGYCVGGPANGRWVRSRCEFYNALEPYHPNLPLGGPSDEVPPSLCSPIHRYRWAGNHWEYIGT